MEATPGGQLFLGQVQRMALLPDGRSECVGYGFGLGTRQWANDPGLTPIRLQAMSDNPGIGPRVRWP